MRRTRGTRLTNADENQSNTGSNWTRSAKNEEKQKGLQVQRH